MVVDSERKFLVITLVLSLFLTFYTSPVKACIWDRDTLASELQSVGDVRATISGRFIRNPPLYYEMRITRLQEELKTDQQNLGGYDDIAVAYDKLGKSDEAIKWMETKGAILEKMDADTPHVIEHRYRYLANLGTFWIHRWVNRGADRKDLSDVQKAHDLIEHALKLNPAAHFNRERYQLRFMKSLLAPVASTRNDPYPNFLGLRDDEFKLRNMNGYGQDSAGLSGLIILGNAWESIDVFRALQVSLRAEGHSSVAYLAQLRWQEIQQRGGRSLLGVALPPPSNSFSSTRSKWEDLNGEYLFMREEAEGWARARTKYMMSRLQEGRHPDTDQNFWHEFNDYPPGARPFWHFTRIEVKIGIWFIALCIAIAAFRLRREIVVLVSRGDRTCDPAAPHKTRVQH